METTHTVVFLSTFMCSLAWIKINLLLKLHLHSYFNQCKLSSSIDLQHRVHMHKDELQYMHTND